MGVNTSSLSDIRKNKLLIDFVGPVSIDEDDEFWSELFSFNYVPPLHRDNDKHLYESVYPLLMDLIKNNTKSQNFFTLLKILIKDATLIQGDLKNNQEPNSVIVKKVTISLFILRNCIKFIIQNYSEKDVMKYFVQQKNVTTKSIPMADYLFFLLFSLLIDLKISTGTHNLLLELISTLIIFLSSQLSKPLGCELPVLYQYVFWGKSVNLANQIVGKLLQIYSANEKPPSTLITHQSGMLWNAASYLASGLLSIVTLGYMGSSRSAVPYGSSNTPAMFSLIDLQPEYLTQAVYDKNNFSSYGCNVLSKQASHLLLLLITQASVKIPSKVENSNNIMRNPYREAFFNLKSTILESLPEASSNNQNPRFDFDQLSKLFEESAQLDSSLLIFYLLVHRNGHFRNILLKDKKQYEKVLLPILGILFKSPVECSNIVYMSLIIVLILTENDKFTRDIHDLPVKKIPWLLTNNAQPNGQTSSTQANNHEIDSKHPIGASYSPSALADISLGSLMCLCLLKTIQRHLYKLKDKYLHINCLAALANLSSRIKVLHPSACHLLFELINVMLRKRTKSMEQLRLEKDKVAKMTEKVKSNEKQPNDLDVEEAKEELEKCQSDLELIEEILRMMLEILNSTLTHSLTKNAHLVYALLYNKDNIAKLRGASTFQDISQNLDAILNYFIYKINKNLDGNPTSPGAVLSLIEKNVDNLDKSQNLRRFPELKFKYVEESNSDEFYLPYIWWLIYLNGMDFFNGCSAGLLTKAIK